MGIELVEDRTVPALVTWDGGGGDFLWNNPVNWSSDALPTAADDILISVAASNPTITSNHNVSIQSIVTNEALTINGGTFQVATTLETNALLRLSGTTLRAAKVSTTSSGSVSVTADSTLDGIRMDANLQVDYTNELTIRNGLTLNGMATLIGNANTNSPANNGDRIGR